MVRKSCTTRVWTRPRADRTMEIFIIFVRYYYYFFLFFFVLTIVLTPSNTNHSADERFPIRSYIHAHTRVRAYRFYYIAAVEIHLFLFISLES